MFEPRPLGEEAELRTVCMAECGREGEEEGDELLRNATEWPEPLGLLFLTSTK